MYQIYLATNTHNGKVYVGQTGQTIERRWQAHQHRAKYGGNTYLSNALRKHHPESFVVDIVDVLGTKLETDLAESLWIALLQSANPQYGYNLTFGGEGGRPTAATVLKQRLSKIGRTRTLAAREATSRSLKLARAEGRYTGNRGKTLPDSMRLKISLRVRGMGHPSYRRDVVTSNLIELYKQGKTMQEIGQVVGMHVESVSRRLRSAGIQSRRGYHAHTLTTKKKIGRVRCY